MDREVYNERSDLLCKLNKLFKLKEPPSLIVTTENEFLDDARFLCLGRYDVRLGLGTTIRSGSFLTYDLN